MTDKAELIGRKISKLSIEEKEELKKYLEQLIYQDKNTYSYKSKEYKPAECPCCKSTRISKNGLNKKKIQTYVCKNCGKFFCDTTGSAIHKIQLKNKWYQFIELLFDGNYCSVRETARLVGISKNTSFRWRHKVLTAIKLKVVSFNGIVELDDIHFNFSQKGRKHIPNPRKRGKSGKKAGDNDLSVKVFAAMDRIDTLKLDVVRVGRLKAKDIRRTGLEVMINPQTNILTSDKHPSIKSFTKQMGFKHETFLAKNHSRKSIYHVNTINERANRLRHLINEDLKGVSTKYLANYTNWFKLVELEKYMKMDYFDLSFHNCTAHSDYHNREINYKNFLNEYSNLPYINPVKWE